MGRTAIVVHGLRVRKDLCDLMTVRAWLQAQGSLVPQMKAAETDYFRPGFDDDAEAERALDRFYGQARDFLTCADKFDLVILLSVEIVGENLAARHDGCDGAVEALRQLWRWRLLQAQPRLIATVCGSSCVDFGFLGFLPEYREPFTIQAGDSSTIDIFVRDDVNLDEMHSFRDAFKKRRQTQAEAFGESNKRAQSRIDRGPLQPLVLREVPAISPHHVHLRHLALKTQLSAATSHEALSCGFAGAGRHRPMLRRRRLLRPRRMILIRWTRRCIAVRLMILIGCSRCRETTMMTGDRSHRILGAM